MKFTVVELQNGIVGANVWTYNTREEAESKYHSVLSVAAVSSVEVHSAALLNEEGFELSYQCYKHEAETAA